MLVNVENVQKPDTSGRLKERADALFRLAKTALAARGALQKALFDRLFHDVPVGLAVHAGAYRLLVLSLHAAQARVFGQSQQRLGHLVCRLFLTTIKHVHTPDIRKSSANWGLRNLCQTTK